MSIHPDKQSRDTRNLEDRVISIAAGSTETKLQDGGTCTYVLGSDSHVTVVLLITSGGTISAVIRLAGEGATAMIVGFVQGHGYDHLNIHTLQHHEAPNTTSNLLVKAVLADASIFEYDGAIRVEKNAQKTNAYQRDENLLLSEHAKARSKPGLEIMANDVRCTHGATIGAINEEELWYLQSRGIPVAKGRELIVQGFYVQALARIEDPRIRKIVEEKIGMRDLQ